MSERKVLNKYYPPDFDPSKIPRVKQQKNRQFTVRLMAPFNMRCVTCGEYIYRGKKFNARKEDVENEDYCGVRIFRFYIKCTRCLQEISFKTDPQNTDYVIEAGATRNFMALKLAEEQEKRKEEELKEEEANNPMKLLENRTQQSKMELEIVESLDELRDLNRRHYNTDFESLLSKYDTSEVQEKLAEMQKEKDDEIVKSLLRNRKRTIRDIEEVDAQSCEETGGSTSRDLLLSETKTSSASSSRHTITESKPALVPTASTSSVDKRNVKSKLCNLVKPKPANQPKPNALSSLAAYSDSDSNSD